MGKDTKIQEYILVDHIFVNLNQNIYQLYYNLYVKAKSFESFDRLARIKLPKFIVRALRILQFTYAFSHLKRRHYETGSISTVTSEHNGNCLVKLRQGEIKIFNFKESLVITTFPQHIASSELDSIVSKIKESEQCTLAPKIINWDVERRFLVEEYKNISVCSYDLSNLQQLTKRISPIVGEIISTSKSELVNLYEYFIDNINFIESVIDTSIQGEKYNDVDLNHIRRFLDYLKEMIVKKLDENRKVTLTFSHGDLWEGNILIKGNHSNVIDWGTHGYRSFYYDFYFLTFMFVSKRRNLDTVDYDGITFLHNQMDANCQLFYSNLFINFNESVIPKQFDLYRYLFYIELISLKLTAVYNAQQVNIKEIATWIERFAYFEELRNGSKENICTKHPKEVLNNGG